MTVKLARGSRLCGDFPWHNRWFIKQSQREPRFFCINCGKLFRTGKFSRFDSKIYDDICPNCGAVGLTLTELAHEYTEEVMKDGKKRRDSDTDKAS